MKYQLIISFLFCFSCIADAQYDKEFCSAIAFEQRLNGRSNKFTNINKEDIYAYPDFNAIQMTRNCYLSAYVIGKKDKKGRHVLTSLYQKNKKVKRLFVSSCSFDSLNFENYPNLLELVIVGGCSLSPDQIEKIAKLKKLEVLDISIDLAVENKNVRYGMKYKIPAKYSYTKIPDSLINIRSVHYASFSGQFFKTIRYVPEDISKWNHLYNRGYNDYTLYLPFDEEAATGSFVFPSLKLHTVQTQFLLSPQDADGPRRWFEDIVNGRGLSGLNDRQEGGNPKFSGYYKDVKIQWNGEVNLHYPADSSAYLDFYYECAEGPLQPVIKFGKQQMVQGGYKNGLPTGKWKFWYPDGVLSEERDYEFKDSLVYWKMYDQAGNLETEMLFEKGKAKKITYRAPVWVGFKNSNFPCEYKRYVENYTNVFEPSKYEYLLKDVPYEQLSKIDDKVVQGQYQDIVKNIPVRNRQKKQLQLRYSGTNSMLMEGDTVNGLPVGAWVIYYPNGKIAQKRFYSDSTQMYQISGYDLISFGKRIGLWQKFDENGKLYAEQKYNDAGELEYVTYYFPEEGYFYFGETGF